MSYSLQAVKCGATPSPYRTATYAVSQYVFFELKEDRMPTKEGAKEVLLAHHYIEDISEKVFEILARQLKSYLKNVRAAGCQETRAEYKRSYTHLKEQVTEVISIFKAATS
jgi:hypothetical protein